MPGGGQQDMPGGGQQRAAVLVRKEKEPVRFCDMTSVCVINEFVFIQLYMPRASLCSIAPK